MGKRGLQGGVDAWVYHRKGKVSKRRRWRVVSGIKEINRTGERQIEVFQTLTPMLDTLAICLTSNSIGEEILKLGTWQEHLDCTCRKR